MRLEDWREQARRDAARRGLPDLDPLLDMLFRSTRALRAAAWARAGGEGTAAVAHRPAGDGGEAGGGRAAGPDADPIAGRTGSPPAPPGTTR